MVIVKEAGEEDETAGRVREGSARELCRGFPLVIYKGKN